jgi:DNA-binding winged helix-turn-helix (wHTH) protein
MASLPFDCQLCAIQRRVGVRTSAAACLTGKGKGALGRTLIFLQISKLVPCLPSKTRFSLGEFTLAPKERLLLCNRQPVHLTPKAFDPLVALVRHGSHLVTKDDLLREVWPDTYVEEVNLTVHISGLRKALDRGGNGSTMIETVPTHGYRFVAPVTLGNVEVVLRRPEVLRSQQDNPEIGRQPTKNADAYSAYIQGRHEWNQRSKGVFDAA